MRKPTFIDIFSGAGLFSAGFVEQGFEPILAIDLAKDAVATYNQNLPPVARVGSVTAFKDIPEADLLIAGPPCQGFSTLGRQDPLDARNDLALDVPRWARASQASVVVIENVPPFLRSGQWRRLAARLRRAGYKIETWELEAADFGTPQLRRRAFTIASRIGSLTRPVGTHEPVAAATAFERPIQPNDALHHWPQPSALAERRFQLIPAGGDKRDILRVAPDLCPPSWARVGAQATDVWGRIVPSEPANTLRCTFQNPSKGRYLHPTANRVISLREGARLQGVPDDWSFVGRPYPVARQIGNGVPIPLSRAIAAAALEAFERASRPSLDEAA